LEIQIGFRVDKYITHLGKQNNLDSLE